MPKAAVGQTGFNTGEISPLCYGVTENPRYKKGLEIGLNYIPTLQGPLLRRPGTKYCANVKDSTKPPILIPFQFSATQNYMLEFGDQYIRFYANNGQVVNAASSYRLSGGLAGNSPTPGGLITYANFYATRANTTPQKGEIITTTTSVGAAAILELPSPYLWADLSLIRWAQNGDTLYLVHPKYPIYKLQRQTQTAWKLQTVLQIDGPYLPANSYLTIGDQVGAQMHAIVNTLPNNDVMAVAQGGTITGAITDPALSGQIQITTSAAHGFTTGQKVFVSGVVGTVEANNFSNYFGRTSTNPVGYWPVQVTSTTTFLLLGSVFVHAYGSGGTVYPAVFAPAMDDFAALGGSGYVRDVGRVMSVALGGKRYWGYIQQVYDAATVQLFMGGSDFDNPITIPSTGTADSWALGVWSGFGPSATQTGNGWPACVAFHQNRLWFAGNANSPQEVDASNTGLYETFSASDPDTLEVTDDRSLSFVLSSEDQNPLRWMSSTAQALLAGTNSSEWGMTPSGNSEALTPTNFNAQQSSFFGSANIAPTKIGNAVMYLQRGARKLRELTYFFQAGTFRSTDLTQISEHITLPYLTKIAVQKETQPLIWGIRSDGVLTSLVYNRDDVALSAGWMRHILGGYSNSGGAAPVVYDIGFIPDPLVSFDQMWLVVKRYINSATVYTVEYMTKITEDSISQEDSFQGDCGGTYDLPLVISGISIAATAVVTSTAHGLSNGDAVKITDVAGLDKTTTDVNGNTSVSNLVNEITFLVAGVTANTFQLHDFAGNAVSSVGYSAWISGGSARKLVSTISGLTWLIGDTVGVLADGGIHPDVVVNNSGAIALNFPAAKVQIGYRYKSQGKLLRAEAGAADGTSIGKTRRTSRAAVQMHRVGDLSIGTDFNTLLPLQLSQVDQNQANVAVPLFSGIIREGLASAYDFNSQLCFEQSSMLPGTIQSITTFMEEQDV